MNNKFSIFEAFKFSVITIINKVVFFFGLGLTYLGIFLSGLLLGGSIIYYCAPAFLQLIINTQLSLSLQFKHTFNTFISTLIQRIWNQKDIIFSLTNWQFLLAIALVGLLFFLLLVFLHMGYIKIGLSLNDTGKARLSMLFSNAHLVLKAGIASLLYLAMVFLGFFFFIVPGIYLMLRYGYYLIILVDKNTNIIEAFKQSAVITRGAMWALFGIFLITVFLSSMAPGFWNLFFIAPLNVLAFIYAYRKLAK